MFINEMVRDRWKWIKIWDFIKKIMLKILKLKKVISSEIHKYVLISEIELT